ncbi:MAG: zinc ribbon domain-containing protein, partial [Acidimicrobiia bacterium]
MIVCTGCGFSNEDSDAFCGDCGEFLEFVGQKVEADAPEEPVAEADVDLVAEEAAVEEAEAILAEEAAAEAAAEEAVPAETVVEVTEEPVAATAAAATTTT